MSEPSGLTPLQERRFIWSHPAVNTKHALFSYLQSSSSLLPRLAYFFVRLLQSESRIVGFNVHNAGHRSKEAHSKENTPELLGVVLLNLRPLLYKFDVELQQVDARLCVLFDLVVLVLWGEQNRVKGHGGIKPRSFALRANSAEGSNRISARSLQAWSWNSTRLLKVQRWVNKIWYEHTGWWMGDFWSFRDQPPCCVWEKLNLLYCQTSADSKSSCFSMTADIHDRLIDDSFFPSWRTPANKQLFPEKLGSFHTHKHTRRSTKQHSSVWVYMCPSIQHTQTHVCVLTGWSLSCSFEYFTRDTTTAPPEQSDTARLPKTCCCVGTFLFRETFTDSRAYAGQSGRMSPVRLVRVCRCVWRLQGRDPQRGQQIPLQNTEQAGNQPDHEG